MTGNLHCKAYDYIRLHTGAHHAAARRNRTHDRPHSQGLGITMPWPPRWIVLATMWSIRRSISFSEANAWQMEREQGSRPGWPQRARVTSVLPTTSLAPLPPSMAGRLEDTSSLPSRPGETLKPSWIISRGKTGCGRECVQADCPNSREASGVSRTRPSGALFRDAGNECGRVTLSHCLRGQRRGSHNSWPSFTPPAISQRPFAIVWKAAKQDEAAVCIFAVGRAGSRPTGDVRKGHSFRAVTRHFSYMLTTPEQWHRRLSKL